MFSSLCIKNMEPITNFKEDVAQLYFYFLSLLSPVGTSKKSHFPEVFETRRSPKFQLV